MGDAVFGGRRKLPSTRESVMQLLTKLEFQVGTLQNKVVLGDQWQF